jgi:Zn-dependent M28 family amino/carboxypeptidase
MKTKPLILTILLIAALSYSAAAQKAAPVLATENDLKEDLKLVPCKNSERLEAVKKFFQKMGAAENEISAEKIKGIQNVLVTKKGETDEIVIIGAHYDKVSEGCGAIDNWTGIVIIGNIYRTMRNVATHKTYIFVAFDREETGLEGSAAMAKSIPKENRLSYCSMVNLDSFGFGYPQVLVNASNSKMTSAAKALAEDLKMPFSTASLAGVADADSTSFNNKDIPAITFHGLSNEWPKYLRKTNWKT